MTSKKTKIIVPIILGVLAIIVLNIFLSSNQEVQQEVSVKTKIEGPASLKNQKNVTLKTEQDDHLAYLEKDSLRDIIQKLQEEYRDVISTVVAQLSLIDLRDFLNESFPDQGSAIFKDIIQTAFPELADKILNTIALMDQYNQWLLDNMLALNDMHSLERNGTVWEKRTELFGQDAEEIWSDELSEAEVRQENVHSTISLLNTAYDIDMNERLFLLKSTLEDNSDVSIESMMIGQGMLGNVFFGFESVQKDLHALDPEERQVQIDAVRRNLGFTEDQIVEAAKADQAKEEVWQIGYKYTNEKKALIASYTGDDLESELDTLRQEYFKYEAKTIRLEESNNFFRFERRRLYGRN